MRGRHRPPRRKAEWKKRAETLAADLSRSEEAREGLARARNRLLEDVRKLSGQLARLQRELGSEEITAPVELVHRGRMVAALKPPETGLIPVQRPDGTRFVVPVGDAGVRRSQGRTGKPGPSWATG